MHQFVFLLGHYLKFKLGNYLILFKLRREVNHNFAGVLLSTLE
ncbi:protein of unknown function [Xenorhabdus doucetiae]|uniref:Uncharacterized protein n=1 Tax=Xenorhabdus doucetiae TaxID=351671 RepID=A0A068QQW7_9GAMM|nr:protein of unknown function [Xenorhabdus doucetiae]